MDTMERVNELIKARGMTLYTLAKASGVSYSTFKSTAKRNGQLTVDTIERICSGIHISMSEFFAGGDCHEKDLRE